MIKLYKDNKQIDFKTTMFPDGTTQVWQVIDQMHWDHDWEIYWFFEQESEFIQLFQLKFLLANSGIFPKLNIPYFPYARQDKDVDNNKTFAKELFSIFLDGFTENTIETYDIHSSNYDPATLRNQLPVSFHEKILPSNAIIVFPDKGATTRYTHLSDRPRTHLDKVRNQQTGEIEGMTLASDGKLLEDQDLYIVDDICDGGATFIGVAKELKKYNPKSINLVVSHGLFSKGTKCLYDAGITKIFTTNSLLRNNKKSKENFEVYNIFDNYVELPYNNNYERKML